MEYVAIRMCTDGLLQYRLIIYCLYLQMLAPRAIVIFMLATSELENVFCSCLHQVASLRKKDAALGGWTPGVYP